MERSMSTERMCWWMQILDISDSHFTLQYCLSLITLCKILKFLIVWVTPIAIGLRPPRHVTLLIFLVMKKYIPSLNDDKALIELTGCEEKKMVAFSLSYLVCGSNCRGRDKKLIISWTTPSPPSKAAVVLGFNKSRHDYIP